MRAINNAAKSLRKPEAAFPVLQCIVRSRALNPNALTPLHSVVAQGLLIALGVGGLAAAERQAIVHTARAVAELPIYEVANPKETSLSYQDVCTYFYSCGNICVNIGDCSSASEAFKMLLLVPAQAMSELQSRGYKMRMLTSLLSLPLDPQSQANLQTPTLPKAASSAISRQIEKGAVWYHKLAKAFVTLDAGAISKVINDTEARAIFAADKTIELVHLVAQQAAKRRIIRLANTYTSVPLYEVARSAGDGMSVHDAEAMVAAMIRAGELNAHVHAAGAGAAAGSDAMLVFGDAVRAPQQAEQRQPQLSSKLQAEIGNVLNAVHRLKAADDELSVSPVYLKRQMQGGGGGSISRAGGLMGFNDHEFDAAGADGYGIDAADVGGVGAGSGSAAAGGARVSAASRGGSLRHGFGSLGGGGGAGSGDASDGDTDADLHAAMAASLAGVPGR